MHDHDPQAFDGGFPERDDASFSVQPHWVNDPSSLNRTRHVSRTNSTFTGVAQQRPHQPKPAQPEMFSVPVLNTNCSRSLVMEQLLGDALRLDQALPVQKMDSQLATEALVAFAVGLVSSPKP